MEKKLEDISTHYQELSSPYSLWIGIEGDLGPKLSQLPSFGSCPGMTLSSTSFLPLKSGAIEFVWVDNESLFGQWLTILGDAFGFDAPSKVAYGSLISAAGFQGPLKHLVGIWNGSVITTGSLLLSGRAGYLFNVATKESARGQGFASHLSTRLAEEALVQGATDLALISSTQTVGLYEKIGFQTTTAYQILLNRAV